MPKFILDDDDIFDLFEFKMEERSPMEEEEEELEEHETFSKRLKFMRRYYPAALSQEASSSGNPDKYFKELRKQHQCKLSRQLHRNTFSRLGVKVTLGDQMCDKILGAKPTSNTPGKLDWQKEKLPSRLQLSKVSIYPEVVVSGTGREMIGTLNAYLTGFRYSNPGKRFEIDVMYSNVKHSFYQDGDQTICPLLHLHLHSSIKVGTKTTKDIQFRMVQTTGSGKQQQIFIDRMHEFLDEVHCIWMKLPGFLRSRKVEKRHGFHGELPPNKPRFFCFAGCCLVDLVNAPPVVVTLNEVEIANLVLVEPEREAFNMTFVFQEFRRDVLQIHGIPATMLDDIKRSLDLEGVKYYQNSDLDLDPEGWRSKLNEILARPDEFMHAGGWNKYNGDSDGYYSDSSAASYENWPDTFEPDYDSD